MILFDGMSHDYHSVSRPQTCLELQRVDGDERSSFSGIIRDEPVKDELDPRFFRRSFLPNPAEYRADVCQI